MDKIILTVLGMLIILYVGCWLGYNEGKRLRRIVDITGGERK